MPLSFDRGASKVSNPKKRTIGGVGKYQVNNKKKEYWGTQVPWEKTLLKGEAWDQPNVRRGKGVVWTILKIPLLRQRSHHEEIHWKWGCRGGDLRTNARRGVEPQIFLHSYLEKSVSEVGQKETSSSPGVSYKFRNMNERKGFDQKKKEHGKGKLPGPYDRKGPQGRKKNDTGGTLRQEITRCTPGSEEGGDLGKDTPTRRKYGASTPSIGHTTKNGGEGERS